MTRGKTIKVISIGCLIPIGIVIVLSLLIVVSLHFRRGYLNMGTSVIFYWGDNLIPFIYTIKKVDADPASFKTLSDIYACDKYRAFDWGEIMEGVDGASCRLLGEDYIVDARHVWFRSFKTDVKDPATFRIVCENLTEDKYDYYWHNKSLNVADKESFVLVKDPEDSSQYYWGKDKYFVYALGGRERMSIADYESFQPLSAYYSKDKFQVYHRSGIVHDADPESFKATAINCGQDKNHQWNGLEQKAIGETFTIKL